MKMYSRKEDIYPSCRSSDRKVVCEGLYGNQAQWERQFNNNRGKDVTQEEITDRGNAADSGFEF